MIRGRDFVAVRQSFQYRTAAPGKKTGSRWTQLIVFPAGQRYFISMDRIDAVNGSDAMFLRIDMPGHIRHKQGDTFEEIYLSYLGGPEGHGSRPANSSRILRPDEKFHYARDAARSRTVHPRVSAARPGDRPHGARGWPA